MTETQEQAVKDTRNIYQRLRDAGAALGSLKNDKKTPQYEFVSHDAVTSAVRSALFAHGVLPVASVKEWAQDGNRTSCTIRVAYYNIDEPKDVVVVEAFGFGIDNQDKGPGKAMSYATKYAHLKALCIPVGIDVEDSNIDHKPEPEKRPEPFTPHEIAWAEVLEAVQAKDFTIGEAWAAFSEGGRKYDRVSDVEPAKLIALAAAIKLDEWTPEMEEVTT